MNPPESQSSPGHPHEPGGVAKGLGLGLICAGLGFGLILGLGGVLSAWFGSDFPGHRVLGASLMYFGLTQTLWIVPMAHRYSKRGEASTATGLVVWFGIGLLLMGACFVIGELELE